MHKLPVGSGFVGLLFAGGSALIFILGFPSLWYFVALSTALGVGIAIIFRLASHRMSDRNKPLSILSAPSRKEKLVVIKLSEPPNFLRTLPNPFSA